jgi:TonB family protein
VAGSEGVPVPKKTKHVQPVYPPEALSQGVRGIVILELVVDARGHVESASVLRSVPGLDEAAIVAARQWEYEPVKLDGKPVSVRLTVPITFALKLPDLSRQEGIPELRQGVNPAWPAAASGDGHAIAEVTLEPDGRIGVARVVEGGPPWSEELLRALRTWRFAAPPEDATVSFRVEAQFAAARGRDPQRVSLRLSGLQTSVSFSSARSEPPPAAASAPAGASGGAPTAPVAQGPAPTPPNSPPPTDRAPAPTAEPGPTSARPPVEVPAAAPPRPATPPARPEAPPAGPAAPAGPPPVASAGPTPPAQAPPQGAATPPAPVEVITVPPPPLPPENGVSALRDVTLEPGVPDLTRGRRPMPPPLARLSGTSGTVEVTFSVSAAGATSVQSVSGADVLKPAAEAAVASWVFRRTRADRAYLVAVFTYAGDKAAAAVRPQAQPGQPPALQAPPAAVPAVTPGQTPPPPPKP